MRHLTEAVTDASDWRDSAACRHHDPDLFFPEGTASPALRQANEAKRVCQSCPVRTACLDFALRHDLVFGIWGGATWEERRGIRHGSAADARVGRHRASVYDGSPW